MFLNHKGLAPIGVNERASIYRIHGAEVNILQSKVMWRFKDAVHIGVNRTTSTYRFHRIGQCCKK